MSMEHVLRTMIKRKLHEEKLLHFTERCAILMPSPRDENAKAGEVTTHVSFDGGLGTDGVFYAPRDEDGKESAMMFRPLARRGG